MAQKDTGVVEAKLSGQTIIDELIRNMELGQFEMGYSVLLPCVFSLYLHPEDHARLAGVLDLIAEDAKRGLRARVAQLNSKPGMLVLKRPRRQQKEFKIAGKDWILEFLPDTEGTVPLGDVEIHSELNETAQPGFRGTKTTLMDREPSVTAIRSAAVTRRTPTAVYAEIRYEDDSGPQLFLVSQNEVRVGRGGDDLPMDLTLYTNDEVSREHLVLRRDPATGRFHVLDKSVNGTWLDGHRLKKGVEQALPGRAAIGLAEVLTLNFEARK
ncbi:MAG TPA: FHA domain-containing protein [Bryobacteraceae bacterium]|nr:FHA domain-containing protein [Bryobacteraceae bacterium]